MKNVFVLFLVVSSGLTMLSGCKHDPAISPDIIYSESCSPDTVYFQNEVLPLLVSNCATSGCHDAATASEGVVLTDYASIIRTAEVHPGQPNKSELYEVLVETDPEKRMPPEPKQSLTSEQIAKIEKWILQGALNNYCDNGNCDTVNVSYANHISSTIQTNCLGCHSGGSPSGGIALTNYNQVVQVANTGQLLGSIQHQSGYSPMPQNGNKLSDCNITQFKKWIENGTPNN